MPDANVQQVIRLLREMDQTQAETDENGGREIAWYYYRDDLERALGLDNGALDSTNE